MDIAEFDGDPRRRGAPEVEFGNDWRDEHGREWRVAWVPGTGEVYAMLEVVGLTSPPRTKDLETVVLGRIHAEEDLRLALDGVEEARRRPDGLAWLCDRLAWHDEG